MIYAAEAPAHVVGAGAEHAFVQGGQLYVREFGQFAPTTRFAAVCIASTLIDSPFESSRRRAREILAAARTVQ